MDNTENFGSCSSHLQGIGVNLSHFPSVDLDLVLDLDVDVDLFFSYRHAALVIVHNALRIPKLGETQSTSKSRSKWEYWLKLTPMPSRGRRNGTSSAGGSLRMKFAALLMSFLEAAAVWLTSSDRSRIAERTGNICLMRPRLSV